MAYMITTRTKSKGFEINTSNFRRIITSYGKKTPGGVTQVDGEG